jgi:Neurotransmitter-gated ion-channel transmembrane region/Neurotransmitter-gated ion-channel ligand binding domain
MLACRKPCPAVLALLCACLAVCCPGQASAQTNGLRPVNVAIRVENLTDVDEVHERWELRGTLITSWLEPALRYRSSDELHDRRSVSIDRMRRPNLGIGNTLSTVDLRQLDLYVRPDGRVYMIESFDAKLATELDLRRFPFDTEYLPVYVTPLDGDIDRIALVPDQARSQLATTLFAGLAQWRMQGLRMRGYRDNYLGDTAHGVVFSLQVQRNSGAYVWKFIVPLSLIVVVSWIGFWLSPNDFKPKDLLGTGVSTLLIVVAFTLSLTTVLPRTSYVTYIDVFLLICFLLVIAAIAATAVIQVLEVENEPQRAMRVRQIVGTILPLLFVTCQAVAFFLFQDRGPA